MQESYKLDKAVRPPPAITNAVSWRNENIVYKKNEVFLDVIESVNLLVRDKTVPHWSHKLNLQVNSNGTLLRSEVVGSIKMKSYLSGMPELRLGLNDRLLFEGSGRCNFSPHSSRNFDFVVCFVALFLNLGAYEYDGFIAVVVFVLLRFLLFVLRWARWPTK